jgi:hypothetical protein
MMLWKLVVLILLGTTVPLTAMAYASPPDPLWLGGVFDDDDDDDVMVLITTTGAVIEPFPLDKIRPGLPPIAAVAPAADSNGPTSTLPSNTARAPPLS